MTQLVQRRTFPEILRDHHTRIRRLEAAPGGGGGSDTDCARCAFANPFDVPIDPAYADCFDPSATGISFPETESLSSGVVLASGSINVEAVNTEGWQLQAAISTVIGVPTGFVPSNVQLIINGAVMTWFGADARDNVLDVGWQDVPGNPSGGGGPCAPLDYSVVSDMSGIIFNRSIGGGSVYVRWVPPEPYTPNALEWMPDGDAYGDVIYFNSQTRQFVTGPRSLPSRAMTYFQG